MEVFVCPLLRIGCAQEEHHGLCAVGKGRVRREAPVRAFTEDLLSLGRWLQEYGVPHVDW